MRIVRSKIPAALAICLLTLTALAAAAQAGTLVQTKTGLVQGVNNGDVNHFLGIPFSQPPVGDLRWQPPADKIPWEGVRQADSFGPACPQDTEVAALIGITEQSEDCLYLNIWTPAADVSGLPVLVWITGGAFQFGAGSQPDYDGAALANKGAVVVTINYRMGALGYMVHPDMAAVQKHSGNYGMLDQLAAMKWVNENISAFGGSPDKVTIFGQSAGGASVWMHLFSPLSKGLFSRAIIQSGSGPSTYFATNGLTGSWVQAASLGQYLGEYMGAATLEEMRALPARDIVAVSTNLHLYFGPVVDGYFLPDDYRRLAGSANDAPVMVGTTKNDAMGWDDPPTTVLEYQYYLAAVFGEAAPAVEAAYPAANEEEAWLLYDFVGTTAGFTEPARFTARAAQAQGLETYRYLFQRVPGTQRGQMWGAHHDAEVRYIFGNLPADEGYTEYDLALSEAMMNYWVNFANAGDPNGSGLAHWPEYGTDENILFIGDELAAGNGYLDSDCDFFQAIAPTAAPDYPGSQASVFTPRPR